MSSKVKSKYSFIDNIIYIFKNLYLVEKKIFVLILFQIPVLAISPLLNMYLPKIVLDNIETNKSISVICVSIFVFIFSIAILDICNKILSAKLETVSLQNHRTYVMNIDEKAMNIDYDLAESPNGRTKYQKAQNALLEKGRIAGVVNVFVQLIINIFGFTAYAGIISKLNPIVVPLLLLTYGIDGIILLLLRKYEHKLKDEKATSFRRIKRLAAKSRDIKLAKDVRIFSLIDLIKYISKDFLFDEYNVERKLAVRRFLSGLESAILFFIRDGAVYAYLIYKLLYSNISAGDVVLYLSAILGFSSWVGGIAEYIDRVLTVNLLVSDIREFLDLPTDEKGKKMDRTQEYHIKKRIEFKNVSFTYPGNDIPTIKNINLVIHSGEKLAIVGENGAGKTTLIKLLCGLYKPTEGVILIDGQDISDLERKDLYSLFSVVFQDARVLPISVLENVSMTAKQLTDVTRVNQCIEKVGLKDKINSLKSKEYSYLVKDINDEATDLSGGEMQKLMLARALYKNAPIVILDEPTASLDPISESEIYQKYDELTDGKTSIYISHRLASTKFCDKIVLIDNSGIIEEGTHDELLLKKGRYANMYDIQSRYYR